MKKNIVIFLALSLSATTFGAEVISEMRTAGGMTVPGPIEEKIQILDNGQVMAYYTQGCWEMEGNESCVAKEVTKQLALLTQESVDVLVAEIAKIESLDLIDKDPTAPICMDAPGIFFTAKKGDAMIELGRQVNCHDLRVQNSDYMIQVMETLQALFKL